ncbi:MAG: arylesterase [Hyphomicrobiaceae bacterium]
MAFVVAAVLSVAVAEPARTERRNVESIKIVAIGDSLVAGYGLAQGQAFPARLEAALTARGHRVEIVNAGVSGDTTAGGLARIDWALTDDTDAVILELGANDALRGLPAPQAQANLDAILTRLGERGLPVLIAGMRAPANWGATYQAAFDAMYPALAERHSTLLYPFFLDGVVQDPNLNQPDGIHPNAQGVEVIVERIVPYVEELIGRIQNRPTRS